MVLSVIGGIRVRAFARAYVYCAHGNITASHRVAGYEYGLLKILRPHFRFMKFTSSDFLSAT